jgi:uncharacterized protein YprB with RNaseH-like and TPR domain
MVSLAEKLKALGVQTGAAKLPVPPPARPYDITAVLSGEIVATESGETFVYEERYAPDYRQGVAAIRPAAPLRVISAWAADERLERLPLEAFAFLDTETSGLAGGTGTYAFLVGAARFVENGDFVLRQFFMRDPTEEAALLDALGRFLAPAQVLVTYNGKALDAPLLNTRYLMHHMPNPTRGYAHLDLLQLARRLWRDRLESRTLKYIEENVLEAPRTLEEVPGYEIPYLYFEYLRTGDARPLKGVFYHNAMDVVTLAALLSHTTGMLADPFQEGIEHGLDVIAMAKLYEHLGDWDTAARLYERGLEMNLGEAPFWEAVRRLSVLQKRRGDFEQAVTLWERAASKGHVYAHVELAKYYEHKSHDIKTALEWTRRAAAELRQAEMPTYVRQHWAAELRRRRDRLASKDKRARSRRLSTG